MQGGVDVIIGGLIIVVSCLLPGKGSRAERQRSTGHKAQDTRRDHLHPAETKGFWMVREFG